MIRDVITAVDLTVWAELSLLIFAGVFAAVSVRTLRTDRSLTDANARIAIREELEERA